MSDGRKEPQTWRAGETGPKPDPPPAPPPDSYRAAYESDSAEWVAARSLERIADSMEKFVAWCKQRW